MKALKWISAIVLGLVSLALLLVLIILFCPGSSWKAAYRFMPAELKKELTIVGIHGNPFFGYTVNDIDFQNPSVQAHVAAVHVRFSFLSLIRRRFTIETLNVDRPTITMLPSEKTGEKKPTEPATKSSWTVDLRDLHVHEGIFGNKADKSAPTVTKVAHINVDGSFVSKKFSLEKGSAEIQGSTVTLSGSALLDPIRVDLKGSAAGAVSGEFSVKGSTSDFESVCLTQWRGASLQLHAALRDAQQWSVKATVDNLWLDQFSPMEKIKQPAHAVLSVSGTGIQPSTARGRGTFDIFLASHPMVSGNVELENKKAMASIQFSSGPLRGKLNGDFDLATQVANLQAKLFGYAHDISQWDNGLVSADMDFAAELHGRWPSAKWKTSVGVYKVVNKQVKAERLRLEARGTSLIPIHFDSKLSAYNVRQGSFTIETAFISVQGSTSAQKFDLDIRAKDQQLQAAGQSTLCANRWCSQWKKFDANIYQSWHLVRPFDLCWSKDGLSIANFHVADGSTQVTLDGRLQGDTWSQFNVAVRDFNLRTLNTAKIVGPEVKGLVTATAQLSGRMPNLHGRVNFKGESLGYNKQDLGKIEARAMLTDSWIQIENFSLEGAGRANLSGRFPLVWPRDRDPDFSVHAQLINFDPKPFAAAFSDVQLTEALMNADVSVDRRHGSFSSQGQLGFKAAALKVPSISVDLEEANLQLVGKGDRLVIETGTAKIKKKKGSIVLSGEANRARPDLHLKAEEFSFSTPLGFSARFNAAIALAGTWARPFVSGDINVLEANYKVPAKKKKKDKTENKKKEEKKKPDEERPSPLAMDVRVKFDRNVWYKEKQTSVEFQGDINARKDPFDPVRLFGTVSTLRGDYFFYGRMFKIEESKLFFAGENPVDPQLNVNATYTVAENKMAVHLSATGSLSKPVIQLTSDPPLEQSDIISVLVTGRPLYELGQSGGGNTDSTQVAQNAVAGYLSEQLRQQIQDKVDLDVLRVNLQNDQVADVTVGKNVTDRLFISLAQTLGPEAERRINADYALTNHWSLEGTSGSLGRYVVDLLFKFGYK